MKLQDVDIEKDLIGFDEKMRKEKIPIAARQINALCMFAKKYKMALPGTNQKMDKH